MIRPARDDDYAAYAVLHRVLVPEDPVPPYARFCAEIAQTIQVAERDGQVIGYVDALLFDAAAHVRNLIVAEDARTRGVGAALMHAAAERCRTANIKAWHLNVAEGNTPAIALYTKLGFRFDWRSDSLVVPWAATLSLPADPANASPIRAEDAARVETTFDLLRGRVTTMMRRPDRVMMQLTGDDASILGMAAYDPGFPGANVFRVVRPTLAGTLFEALRPHARHDYLMVLVEGDEALTAMLEAAGATVRRRINHMSGDVP
ncbi:MAG: GNAT family N-acetyltransferase [Myxococcota bacterium]|nr:GNAT family N-acetyltransferase [Myxococcota bacterium]